MDGKSSFYTTLLQEAAEAAAVDSNGASSSLSSTDHGWQKVVYPKRQRRSAPAAKNLDSSSTDLKSNGSHVFASVEQKAHERRRALESAAAAAAAAEASESGKLKGVVAGLDDDDEGSDEEGAAGKENGAGEVKKVKQKKPKKPKVTVGEAASKIDASDLAAFLIDITNSYESQPDIQLMRFADYFGRAFASVSASQFPWTKMFKESPVTKLIDVPLSHISEPVYKTAADWIAQRPLESLGSFVLWSLDCILADLTHQQGAVKGSKKPVQQPSSKAQVAIFVVLAMTLRRKPDVLINLLSTLKDNTKYQGQDKLPVIIWMIAQASQGDLVVGMYSWTRYLLPLVYGKSSPNPQSRDLLLQLVERFLSSPKARPILLNGAVRKGERLVPPSALELLWHATFPAASARVKATERFEAVYPTLREVALAGSAGSKAMKPVAQQLLSASVRAMREDNSELSKEATGIFIWCLTQNADCFKQWENIHLENVVASVSVLRKLSDEWKEHSVKFSPDVVREAVKTLRAQNEEALAEEGDDAIKSSIKEADKYCKVILGRLARQSKCVKSGLLLLTVAVAVGALAVNPNIEDWDWNKLHVMLSSPKLFFT